MENYRRIKVIGKGSFGFAVLVQSQTDGELYVMKVNNFFFIKIILLHTPLDNRCFQDESEAKTRHFK